MTTKEYEILDELYFVISFDELLSRLNLTSGELEDQLMNMIDKEWVNYYEEIEGEINPQYDDKPIDLTKLFFLASKKGLFVHHST